MINDIYIFDNIIDSKAQKHIQDIIFNKIDEDKEVLEIFKNWVKNA